MTRRPHLLSAVALITGTTIIAAYVAAASSHWVGTTMPGFFVDPIGTVSVITLPGWPETGRGWPLQIGSVDDIATKDAASLYRSVRAAPTGRALSYAASRFGIDGYGFTAAPRVLSLGEYLLSLLALVVNGCLAIAVGALLWQRHPSTPGIQPFFFACLTLGCLAIASVGSAASGELVRLQILAQALAPAPLIHLALVFPRDVFGRGRGAALFAIYAPFAALALIYQVTWPDPYGSAILHAAATLATIAAAALLTLHVLLRLGRHDSIVVRRRAAIAGSGILAVALVAAFWVSLAGYDLRGVGAAGAASGAVLALAFGSAITARDFFVLDERLRSILTYGIAVPLVMILYFGAGHWIDTTAARTSPFVGTLAHLAVLFAVAPVIRMTRGWIDRTFSPERYSPQRSLDHLNRGLSSARTTQTLVSNTLDVLRRTLKPRKATVYLRARGAGFPLAAYDDPEQRKLAVPADLAGQLESGENVVRYQWSDVEHDRGGRRLLDRLDVDLLVPLYRNGSCVGVIALAAKQSGHAYGARDLAFIRAAADQIALALPNAAAQDKLDILHHNLAELDESLRIQTNRTETLKTMNAELGAALEKMRETHHRLAQNQRAILHAERLDALTRLSVGLTQEISGPLNTVLNTLRAIARIGGDQTERSDSKKQSEAIDEMVAHAQTSAAWLERTIAYLRSFQALGRGAVAERDQHFAVRDAFADVNQLLRLRQRQSGCSVEYREDPPAIELYGSRQKFALILVDLVTGAIQAYDEAGNADGSVIVEAGLGSDGVYVNVIDWAGGLPPAAIPRLLDQLGSDELIGNRRGLWIAKNLVEEGFGGSLEAITNDQRICFTAVFPMASAENGPLAPPPRREAS